MARVMVSNGLHSSHDFAQCSFCIAREWCSRREKVCERERVCVCDRETELTLELVTVEPEFQGLISQESGVLARWTPAGQW